MTTSYLAQKLMTIKLDKAEGAKIKWLKESALEEKHKILESLQLLRSKESQQSCRLCLRPGTRRIFDSWDLDIAADIKSILGIEIKQDDGQPQHICRSCENTVRAAAQLKQTVETTQWLLQQELEMVSEQVTELDEPQSKKHHGGYFIAKGKDITREWQCRKCSSVFQNREEFVDHEKTPTCRRKSKGCVCEICGLEFKSLFLLKRHRMIHSDDPGAFKCTYCSYRARTKYAVTVHERWHTGARPLRCPLCARTFPNAAGLWAHNKRHLPPKYHCDVCAKSFRFKALLVDHVASQHSSEKRFLCSSCGKAFATRKKALRHERRVHNRPRMRQLEKTYLRTEQPNS